MQIARLQHGKIQTLDVVPLADVTLDKIPQNGQELVLTRIGDLPALILPGQAQPLVIDAADQNDHRNLHR